MSISIKGRRKVKCSVCGTLREPSNSDSIKGKLFCFRCLGLQVHVELERTKKKNNMNVLQQDVIGFMTIADPKSVPTLFVPRIPNADEVNLCEDLLFKESFEIQVHLNQVNAVKSIKDQEDLVAKIVYGYVNTICACFWGLSTFGVDFQSVWNEVLRANISLVNGSIILDPETNKILKPEGWKPPDIIGVLRSQAKQFNETDIDLDNEC